jgi:ATP-dependent RNA circularization protein (DNA/RNA ligase family)
MEYNSLPDWFLTFDVYDQNEGRFLSTTRRNELTKRVGLSSVPAVFTSKTNLEDLKQLVLQERSRFRSGSMEGIVIRRENSEWLEARAKLVHTEFIQEINEHWTRRAIEWNRLSSTSNQST